MAGFGKAWQGEAGRGVARQAQSAPRRNRVVKSTALSFHAQNPTKPPGQAEKARGDSITRADKNGRRRPTEAG